MQNHWQKLTLFLRQAGAPLDNNVCERALKKAILHRKNALFYKTLNGARVGDLFMSLIYTCELNEVNPFDYLTRLQEHADEVATNPERWLPWNYRAAVTANESGVARQRRAEGRRRRSLLERGGPGAPEVRTAAADAIAWCMAVLEHDRVGFIAREPLESWPKHLPAIATR